MMHRPGSSYICLSLFRKWRQAAHSDMGQTAESLVLQDSEEYLASVASGYLAESDGAWTYTRLAVEGKTTGNSDVDSILFLWVKKLQSGTDDGNITAYLL